MSIAFNVFGIFFLVSSTCAVKLSVCMGVCGWGCPSSSSVWCMEMAVLTFINKVPVWFAKCWVRHNCLLKCHLCRPWTCVLLFGYLLLVQINMTHCCGLPGPCCLTCRWVLLLPVMPCSPKIAYTVSLCILLDWPAARQVRWVGGVGHHQCCVREKKSTHTSWLNFFPTLSRVRGMCLPPLHIASLPHNWAWNVGMVGPKFCWGRDGKMG